MRAAVLDATVRHRAAFDAYLQALDLGPTEVERQRIERGLATHGEALGRGWVTLGSAPLDAEKRVAGVRFAGRRTVGLAPGVHRVTARLDDHELAVDELRVRSAGSGATFDLSLVPLKTKGWSAPDPGTGPAEGDSGTLAWTLVGVGGAAIVTGVVMQVLAADAAAKADELVEPRGDLDEAARRQRCDDAISDKEGLDTAGLVLYGLGAASAITGVVLLLTADPDDADAALQLEAGPLERGAFVGLRGSF